METEKSIQPNSGYLMVFVELTLVAAAITLTVITENPVFMLLLIPFFFILPGFFIVNPNDSKVLVLFGKYIGTCRENGFFWANPFLAKTKITLKARNLEGEKIKVNDKHGNPIIIGAIVVWQVENTARAKFEVDNYDHYVKVQSDAAVRHLAGNYSYDNFDDEKEITLRGGGEQINAELEKELLERLSLAGVKIIEARLTHLAYAEEIAGAMLQRQQATAIVAARTKIVEGAVGMVELALHKLKNENIIDLDEEKKAAMVSNLLVVLCSDRAANPVINAGTLHQ